MNRCIDRNFFMNQHSIPHDKTQVDITYIVLNEKILYALFFHLWLQYFWFFLSKFYKKIWIFITFFIIIFHYFPQLPAYQKVGHLPEMRRFEDSTIPNPLFKSETWNFEKFIILPPPTQKKNI